MLASQRRWIARVALVVLLGTFSSPLFAAMHLALADDPACDPSGLGPRHPASQFEQAHQSSAAEHCSVCHWIRVVSHRGPVPLLQMDVLRQAQPFVAAALHVWAGQTDFARLAPRAPPAISL